MFVALEAKPKGHEKPTDHIILILFGQCKIRTYREKMLHNTACC